MIHGHLTSNLVELWRLFIRRWSNPAHCPFIVPQAGL